MNTALLLSGGIGSRMAADVPKQYVRVCGKMLATFALEPLLKSSYIDNVQIVAEYEWREAILADAKRAGLDTGKITGFADPGRNRQESILKGLENMIRQKKDESDKGDTGDADDVDTVLIHDAARPLLNGKLIEECYAALAGHDGVMPILPMKDTVYLSKSGMHIDGLLERSHIYAGQAPELFVLKKYWQANTALVPDRIMEINGSAEPAVLAGMDIAMIPGDEGNFKVTTGMDLKRLQECLSRTMDTCMCEPAEAGGWEQG